MNKFNLEKALAGEKVITRDGREALYSGTLNLGDGYPLFFIMDNESVWCTKDGKYNSECDTEEFQLFMASIEANNE